MLDTQWIPESLTAAQAADYLQINRGTVYRYIREGKLAAARLGRSYRIPKAGVELLLWAARTRSDLTLRLYTGAEIAEFLEADQLDEQARWITNGMLNLVPRSDRSVGKSLPFTPPTRADGPCSIEEINASNKGWVLVHVTARDEYDTAIEGIVIARGKKRIQKKLAEDHVAEADLDQTYRIFRAGVVSLRRPASLDAG